MTPELLAELEKIGWQRASRHPWRKARFEKVLCFGAGMIAPNPQEAKAALKRHRALCKAVVNAVEGMRSLSEDAATSINLWSTPPEERNGGWPDHVSVTLAELERLAPGLMMWTECLEHEAKKGVRGGRKNEPAYRVAEVLAEIYVVGMRKKPTIGKLEGSKRKGPSGLYGQVTEAVFSILKVGKTDVINPCKAAIAGLTEGKMKRLLDDREVSIFGI